MITAVEDMGTEKTFKGYGPEQGYSFLREKIAKFEYQDRNIDISSEEIFISDGTKCDMGNILDIFGQNRIGIMDPSYPVYIDTNIMCGNGNINQNSKDGIVFLRCNKKNDFSPDLPKRHIDIIYLCSPNNPTGKALSYSDLEKWVNYAYNENAIILFDGAYERFIESEDIPHSIYEVPKAKSVAIEFRSFSKTAGFTGVRCAYTVIPNNLHGFTQSNQKFPIHQLWKRRVNTKFNGVSYITQKGAEAIFSLDGQKEVREIISYYKRNANLIRKTFEEIGLKCWGGINSPYIWIESPSHLDSWEFFDLLLEKVHVVSTPGIGFGPSGAKYIRLTGFGSYNQTQVAMDRIKTIF